MLYKKLYNLFFLVSYSYRKIINLINILICKFNKNKKIQGKNEQMSNNFIYMFLTYNFLK